MNTRDPWFLVPRRLATPSLRLFCFPFAGGGASVYRSWPDALPADVEVVGVQLPGREGRFAETRYTRLVDLIPELAEAVAPHTEVPFAFFGHSLGGLIAYSLTCELRRQALAGPQLLMVSGRRAPHRPDLDEPIHDLPHDDFIAKIREFAGTPEAILENDELLELLVPILRSDFSISETHEYVREEPLDIPIHSMGGAEDAEVPVDDVHAWAEVTTGRHSTKIFPGGHFYFLDDPTPLVTEVRHHVERVRGTSP